MILEVSSGSTTPARHLESRGADSSVPVTAVEKFERHGHGPALFLIPGAAIDVVERALFAAGFETIALRGDSLGREHFAHLFELLYSAGFVILVAAEVLDAEVSRELRQEHAERTVFDVSSGADEISGNELISRVLPRARSLRLGTHVEKGG
jgi:hypothetical protein